MSEAKTLECFLNVCVLQREEKREKDRDTEPGGGRDAELLCRNGQTGNDLPERGLPQGLSFSLSLTDTHSYTELFYV